MIIILYSSEVCSQHSGKVHLLPLLLLLPGVLVMISSFTLAMGNIGAARKLHTNLLTNNLHSPQSFFDTTPVGRLINRFSKDIYVIDETLPSTVFMFLGTFFVSLSTMIVIVFSTPIFAVVIVPLTLIYIFVQVFPVKLWLLMIITLLLQTQPQYMNI